MCTKQKKRGAILDSPLPTNSNIDKMVKVICSIQKKTEKHINTLLRILNGRRLDQFGIIGLRDGWSWPTLYVSYGH